MNADRESRIVMKTWQFVISQVIILITIIGFGSKFVGTLRAEMVNYAYPKVSGDALKESVIALTETMKENNKVLTDLRLTIAKKFG